MTDTNMTLATCRLCSTSLREYELEARVCSVCETYAEQLGVRNPADLQRMIADLTSDPTFNRISH
jgi:hypothetical protein